VEAAIRGATEVTIVKSAPRAGVPIAAVTDTMPKKKSAAFMIIPFASLSTEQRPGLNCVRDFQSASFSHLNST
jgi:hypothetical protein